MGQFNGFVMPTHIVAVAGIVVNNEGNILLVKHNRRGWVYPGGQVEVGENLVEALKREILEESGIEVDVNELFCIASNVGKHPGYNGVKEVPTIVNLDFICKSTGGQIHSSEENSETKWFTKENAEKLIQNPAMAARFKAFLNYKGRPHYIAYISHPSFEMKIKRLI